MQHIKYYVTLYNVHMYNVYTLCNASLEALPGSAKYFLIYLAILTYLFHL